VTERRLARGADIFPYLDEGEGAPILFLHGIPGDGRIWAPHLARLAPRFRCIAPTMRWFGPHQWRADGPAFGTHELAQDLVAFLEALGAGPVSLVAFSFGCHVALAAAARRPDLVARLLAFEPGFSTWMEDEAELAAMQADAAAAFGPVFASAGSGDLNAAVAAMIDASGGAGCFGALDPDLRAVLLDSRSAVPRLLAQTPPVPLGCADLAALRPPTTIIWGGRSGPRFRLPSIAAARCIGGAGHREFREADHLWPLTAPDAFADWVAEWTGAP
jgi:pimeloyl-ACP methyl ester carboxylesterase